MESGSQTGFHLTTKEYDDDSGLYYFNARWYDPELGRFISKDKNKKRLYSYCKNSPLKYYDENGKKPKALNINWEKWFFGPIGKAMDDCCAFAPTRESCRCCCAAAYGAQGGAALCCAGLTGEAAFGPAGAGICIGAAYDKLIPYFQEQYEECLCECEKIPPPLPPSIGERNWQMMEGTRCELGIPEDQWW